MMRNQQATCSECGTNLTDIHFSSTCEHCLSKTED